MFIRTVTLAVGMSLCLPLAAVAASGDDLAEIRQQMEALKRAYDTRIKALEARLREAETTAEQNRATLAQQTETAPETNARQSRPGDFNPALSVILQGSVNSFSQDPDSYVLPGFQRGDEAGLAREGLTLNETELTVSTNVDPMFYAQSTMSLSDTGNGTEINIEEAFVDPIALPAGFGARFGRFYSAAGYLNQRHSHAWDFHDTPLVYRAFFGGQYGDDGVRLTWTAPTDLYLMLGTEALAGNGFPAGQSQSVGGDVHTLFAQVGGDAGDSWAWQAGASALLANANKRAGNNDTTLFNGHSDLYGSQLVLKWAPNGNPQTHNLILQGEYYYRDESGNVAVSDGVNAGSLAYKGNQTGWYTEAVYQFMPQWRAGLRYDRLASDNHLRVLDQGGFADTTTLLRDSGLDDGGNNPHRWTLMFDWSPSEFSRLRAQYDRDNSRPSSADNQWSLQYIMSLGSHGAHLF